MYDLAMQVPCDQLDYSIESLDTNGNSGGFIIDKTTVKKSNFFFKILKILYESKLKNTKANIYLMSSKIADLSLNSKYLLIINAVSQSSIYPDRFSRIIQRNLTIFVESSKEDLPMFETEYNSAHILENTPKDSLIMSLKYKTQTTNNSLVKFSIDQKSNFQVEDYFYLKYSQSFETIYLLTKTSPIPTDKPEINFQIRLSKDSPSSSSFSSTRMNIRVLTSSPINTNSLQPVFLSPIKANYFLNLNPSTVGLINNTAVFQLETSFSGPNRIILYSIVNQHENPFYIDNNLLRIYYPFSSGLDSKRTSYLVRSLIFNFGFIWQFCILITN